MGSGGTQSSEFKGHSGFGEKKCYRTQFSFIKEFCPLVEEIA